MTVPSSDKAAPALPVVTPEEFLHEPTAAYHQSAAPTPTAMTATPTSNMQQQSSPKLVYSTPAAYSILFYIIFAAVPIFVILITVTMVINEGPAVGTFIPIIWLGFAVTICLFLLPRSLEVHVRPHPKHAGILTASLAVQTFGRTWNFDEVTGAEANPRWQHGRGRPGYKFATSLGQYVLVHRGPPSTSLFLRTKDILVSPKDPTAFVKAIQDAVAQTTVPTTSVTTQTMADGSVKKTITVHNADGSKTITEQVTSTNV